MADTIEYDPLISEIKRIIEHKVSNNPNEIAQIKIYSALKLLLNGDYEKYSFNSNIINTSLYNNYNDYDNFQSLLSKINEKQNGRQETGRYYTPKDVTEYVVANSYLSILYNLQNCALSSDECKRKITNSKLINELIYEYSVFDPTCGSGEFLVCALELKLSFLENPSAEDVINILKTIHGNDINIVSIEISKIRLFFIIISKLLDYNNLNLISEILNKNFYNEDFINIDNTLFSQNQFGKFNIIVGNPPYVEDNKSITKPNVKYGNIYANVLENSSNLLKDNSVMGFVLPLSYVATKRMKKIRDLLNHKTPKQILLNYADRPDCLFTGVHQKLTILISSNSTDKLELYTSGYNYWYKSERTTLLSNKKSVLLDDNKYCFIPKLSNKTEKAIFEKIIANKKDPTFLNLSKDKQSNLFLNMRACFWIKAFSFNPGSNEYKGFHFDEKYQQYILCLLNSNLFFFFWIVTSDCWHITNKELSLFKVIIEQVNFEKFQKLAENLERKLEESKQFIGTKQTEYAYKHKYCKSELDAIDAELVSIYKLTLNEVDYIKNFQLKYRMSDK